MSAPIYSVADYTAAFINLRPRGAAWAIERDAVQVQVMAGLAHSYARSGAAAARLIDDIFPRTTVGLLPEWEASLGLPDPCAGPQPSLQARQAQVVARFANPGGQSADYYTRFALDLGYVVTVQNLSPFRVGFNRCGQQLGGVDWANAWAVEAPLTSERFFRAGQSAAGERLAEWGNAVLECELNNVKPGHTILLFRYA